MDEQLRLELIHTGYVHAPLPLHQELSIEASLEEKEVLLRRVLWQNGAPHQVRHIGMGGISIVNGRKTDGKAIRLTVPTSAGQFPEGSTSDGDYTNFGSGAVVINVSGESWEAFNRLALWVKPDSFGARAVHLRLGLKNEGQKSIPDEYMREGTHLVNLVNHEWNYIIWEFAALPKDKVTELSFRAGVDGKDTSTGDHLQFDFDEIELQSVKVPEVEKGWLCKQDSIVYSTSGYWINGAKTAISNTGEKEFYLLNQEGESVFSGAISIMENERGRFEVLDFSTVNEPGNYQIRVGSVISPIFEIGPKVMEGAVWKVINFLFCERCGYPVPEKHGICHMDVIAEHNGVKLTYAGGWHDAGDMSQQTIQTAEVTQTLFELSEQVKDNPLLHQRLMEEAQWGLEFVLRTRFGDGYRATSVPIARWTNGKIGDMDDIPVRVHNHAYENFQSAAIEACAAKALQECDSDLAWKCAEIAKEDYRFASARFAEKGMELPIMWEHTFSSGASQYYAAACWAAASIYACTGEQYFADEAEKYGDKLLSCQDTGQAGIKLKGFFYRDETRERIVHYTHQSREQAFVQALEALCRALPNSKSKYKWEEGMRLYGEYLKALLDTTAPYGMLSAGVYKLDEINDRETFELLHLLVDFDQQKVNYIQQLKAGIPLGNDYFIRRFPVWFSFRGNTAIHLSMGKAASIVGRYLNDEKLIEVAREQLYWVAGKNPFGQSLMYGEGQRYCQQDANFPGEMTGELPVGIETYENEDAPYWPQGNNATYKEVWTTSAGKWIGIIADLYNKQKINLFH